VLHRGRKYASPHHDRKFSSRLLKFYFILGLLFFYLSNIQANDDPNKIWEVTYNGEIYDSFQKAEDALKANPQYLEVWKSGGAVASRDNETFTHQYKAITSYYFANERRLNGLGGRVAESTSIGEVLSGTIAQSEIACQTNWVFNPRILSMFPVGSYDRVLNQLPVSYQTTSRSRDNECQVAGRFREDIIKANLAYPEIIAKVITGSEIWKPTVYLCLLGGRIATVDALNVRLIQILMILFHH